MQRASGGKELSMLQIEGRECCRRGVDRAQEEPEPGQLHRP